MYNFSVFSIVNRAGLLYWSPGQTLWDPSFVKTKKFMVFQGQNARLTSLLFS